MRKFVNLAIVSLIATVMVSCSEKQNGGDEYLEVTLNNISGVWKMESYDNGELLADGSYYYINLVRNDKSFVSYSNLESMGLVKRTGRFDIEIDGAAIIRGKYDFEQGDWKHRYYIRDLTNNRMVWVATDDESLVTVYVRSELPAEIE
jgi:hypothetical protein